MKIKPFIFNDIEEKLIISLQKIKTIAKSANRFAIGPWQQF